MEMSNREFVPPYDEIYSKQYNSRWQNNELWAREAEFHIETFRELIGSDTKWLDVGCGTGYFLSKFSGTYRAGFDLSETMLDVARTDNSSAVFFKKHDIIEPNPDWDNKWSLVSCTGQPWAYLKSIEKFEQVVKNLYSWTANHGICLLTPIDALDLFGLKPDYRFDTKDIENLRSVMKAVIWTCKEEDGLVHENLIYPNIDQWVRWLSFYFWEIELKGWDVKSYGTRRCYILCKRKKAKPSNDLPIISFDESFDR
jgi:SAM-dependent methyltransferase